MLSRRYAVPKLESLRFATILHRIVSRQVNVCPSKTGQYLAMIRYTIANVAYLRGEWACWGAGSDDRRDARRFDIEYAAVRARPKVPPGLSKSGS